MSQASDAMLLDRFAVPRQTRSRSRWVRAALGICVHHVDDTFAGPLGAYGNVDPALAERLDPALRRLRQGLYEMLTLLDAGEQPG